MTTGTLLTLWTARFSFLLYACALAAWLTARPRAARLTWTAGLLVYLAHVAAAFHFQHHWSHAAAYAETARQTAALFAVQSGSGLYFNYVFTLVWALDVLWLWRSPGSYARRPMRIAAPIHAFLAFMFFNATVVFGRGSVRWMGAAAFAALAILWFMEKRPAPATRS